MALPVSCREVSSGHLGGKAAEIVCSELGRQLSPGKIRKLIAKSKITDLRNGGQHTYVSARRLFWVIRELQTTQEGSTN